MVYNGYYKVMSNIPKMGHLPTPVKLSPTSKSPPRAAPRIAGPIATEGDIEHNLLTSCRMDQQDIKGCIYFDPKWRCVKCQVCSPTFFSLSWTPELSEWVVIHTVNVFYVPARTRPKFIQMSATFGMIFTVSERILGKLWNDNSRSFSYSYPYYQPSTDPKEVGYPSFWPFQSCGNRIPNPLLRMSNVDLAAKRKVEQQMGMAQISPPQKNNGFNRMVLQSSAAKPTKMRVERLNGPKMWHGCAILGVWKSGLKPSSRTVKSSWPMSLGPLVPHFRDMAKCWYRQIGCNML